jgi:hypothetical protein
MRRFSRRLTFVAVMVAAAVAWTVDSAARNGPRTWPHGVVHYYDATGMTQTVATAVAQWNTSGAHIRFVPARSARSADLVLRVDDRQLLRTCGSDCLGFSSDIGMPPGGRRGEVLLSGGLSTIARPLSVWVAAHELGHVLGLQHRRGKECSLMSAHAFDTRCPPSLDATSATPEELRCVPAPADVEAAARLYGGAPRHVDAKCR